MLTNPVAANAPTINTGQTKLNVPLGLCGHGSSANVLYLPLGSRLEDNTEKGLRGAPKALETPLHYHLCAGDTKYR
jgi:hypothetical protein